MFQPEIQFRSPIHSRRNKRRREENPYGFTLIELLVVVAIIVILIALLVPSLTQVREQSKRVACSSNLRSLAQITHIYAAQNSDYVPIGRASNYRWVNYWFVDSSDDIPEFYMFGALYNEKLISDGRIAYCPSQKTIGSYTYKSSVNPWPPTFARRTRAGYSMRSEYIVANLSTVYKPQYPKLINLENKFIMSDLICEEPYVVSGHQNKLARAMADGSVMFVPLATIGADGKPLSYQVSVLKLDSSTSANKIAKNNAVDAIMGIFDHY